MQPTPNFKLNAQGQPCYKGKPMENLDALIAHANVADALAAAIRQSRLPMSMRIKYDPEKDRQGIDDALKLYEAASTFLPH